jgi:predicted DNA-binding transcriptional regulator YafY
LLQLVDELRRHRFPVSGAQLAQAMGVSLRTLYRDIATLQAQGAPIEGEAGIGYVLRPGFMLPPLMFTEDEIEALALGSRWVAAQLDARLADAARHALARIAAVLPAELRRSLETSGLLVPGNPSAADAPTEIWLTALRLAIRQEQRVEVEYLDLSGQPSTRVLWPFALGFFAQVRVLAAWCELRQDFRSFRTDRITRLQTLGTRYPTRRQVLLQRWREREAVCVKPVVAPFFQPVIKSGPQGVAAAATAALTTLSRSGLSVTAP